MRLIDRDELWNELGIIYEHNKGDVCWNDALLEIKNAPIIDERKMGKWNMCYDDDAPQDGVWFCSVCGYARLVDDISPQNFCPNCGSYNGGKNEV